MPCTSRRSPATPPAAVTTRYELTGCASVPSALGSTATVAAPTLTLPALVPYFGLQRSRRAPGRLGTIRSVYLAGLPPGTRLSVACRPGCGKGRSFTAVVRRDGTLRRTLRPGWPVGRASRVTLTASATRARPQVARFRFVLRRDTLRAKPLAP